MDHEKTFKECYPSEILPLYVQRLCPRNPCVEFASLEACNPFEKGWKNHKISLCCSVTKCYKWLTQYKQTSKSNLLQHVYLTVIKSTFGDVDISLLV